MWGFLRTTRWVDCTLRVFATDSWGEGKVDNVAELKVKTGGWPFKGKKKAKPAQTKKVREVCKSGGTARSPETPSCQRKDERWEKSTTSISTDPEKGTASRSVELGLYPTRVPG